MIALEDGDRLDFKAGSMAVGTFYASSLPTKPTKLLLVAHRKDNVSMAVVFESHAFAQLATAQVATGAIQIRDPSKEVVTEKSAEKNGASLNQESVKSNQRVEELRYNSVLALNPGHYEVGLPKPPIEDKGPDFRPLTAIGEAKYVIMRVGIDEGDIAADSQLYPEELVVFPNSGAYQTARHLSVAIYAAAASSFALCIFVGAQAAK